MVYPTPQSLRRTGRAIFALVTVCGLTACVGSCTRGAGDHKLILTYTRWGYPAEMDSTRQLIAQFERENPDITVHIDVVSWDQYWQKMMTAVVTHTCQDVWLMSPAYVEQYAGAGIPIHVASLDQSGTPERVDGVLPALGDEAVPHICDREKESDRVVSATDDEVLRRTLVEGVEDGVSESHNRRGRPWQTCDLCSMT